MTFIIFLWYYVVTLIKRRYKIKAMINLTEKLKIAMIKRNVTQTKLAELTDQTQTNLANKFRANNFKLSEYEKLVNALGCTMEINIVLPTGEKV